MVGVPLLCGFFPKVILLVLAMVASTLLSVHVCLVMVSRTFWLSGSFSKACECAMLFAAALMLLAVKEIPTLTPLPLPSEWWTDAPIVAAGLYGLVVVALMLLCDMVLFRRWWRLPGVFSCLALCPPIWGCMDAFLMEASVVASVLLLLAQSIFVIWRDVRWVRSKVTRLSVVEAVRKLPEGVLCATKNGQVLLMNDAMRSCFADLGRRADLASTVGLSTWLEERGESTVSNEDGSTGTIILGGSGRAWMFVADEVKLAHGLCDRVIAFDVTGSYQLNLQIKEMNARLAETAASLHDSVENLQLAAENEAVLIMKSRVHDVIGQRLSILHRSLEDGNISDETVEQLQPLLSGILDDLASSDNEPETDLNAIVSSFSLAGVEVNVAGSLPDDKALAAVLVDALREAATNAVFHGQAHRVDANIECRKDEVRMTVTNDGESLVGDFRIGGGIGGMRRAVGSLGGTVQVVPRPRFTVLVEMPCTMGARER
ncbi:sensory histidine kinase UhpB [Slackia heliotrinireducens]|uniref:histidine kinase n=1 Tax=Slackia heliotrinireducens (strain ATCC 29202 / DSM 20476 / NCTC 11029 / RHS 1) TaxID=471855 RepID=C7N7Q8_SLAHD|nr:ATP-binding protein [Slackia heliotrinireducens]ACV22943.1 histidine kinase [Slackia heliotrinireducens DSM 20476]VEH01780.1 sensory histidine kinase UhpB [Slackia heliotrinireducens]